MWMARSRNRPPSFGSARSSATSTARRCGAGSAPSSAASTAPNRSPTAVNETLASVSPGLHANTRNPFSSATRRASSKDRRLADSGSTL